MILVRRNNSNESYKEVVKVMIMKKQVGEGGDDGRKEGMDDCRRKRAGGDSREGGTDGSDAWNMRADGAWKEWATQ